MNDYRYKNVFSNSRYKNVDAYVFPSNAIFIVFDTKRQFSLNTTFLIDNVKSVGSDVMLTKEMLKDLLFQW